MTLYKVQEVAKIAGVSVRTLHHYDSVGLLKPSNIGSNRYRYYNDDDLKLLQHILFFKELGFSLKKIQEIRAGGFDPNHALSQHVELLRKKKERIEKLIENAETTQLEYAGAMSLSNEERFSAFSIKKTDDNIKKYTEATMADPVEAVETPAVAPIEENEAVSSIGEETPAVSVAVEEKIVADTAVEQAPAAEEAQETKPEKEEEDLEEINKEGNRIYNAIARLMHLSPDASDVQKEVDAYYQLLDRFYKVTPKMFRGLGDLYASDSRFTRNIDQHGEGLANYLKRAMYVYADGLNNA